MKLVSLQKLAASRNVSANPDLFTSMDFGPWLLLKNLDFSNRQRLKVS